MKAITPQFAQDLTWNDKQISFGKTIDPLLGKIKTVTRRLWTPKYVQNFLNHVEQGKPVYATTNWKNGEIVGTLHIFSITKEENIGNISQEEVNKEGYPNLFPNQFLDKFFPEWQEDLTNNPGKFYYRIEFQVNLFEGFYRPYTPPEKKAYRDLDKPIIPVRFNRKQQQIKQWKAWLLAFDLSQDPDIEKIEINSDYWEYFTIVHAANNGVDVQLLRGALKAYRTQFLNNSYLIVK